MKRRRSLITIATATLCGLLAFGYIYIIRCEGRFAGTPMEADWAADGRLAAIETSLRSTVSYLSVTVGPRNPPHYVALCKTEAWIRDTWQSLGYAVGEQKFMVENLECTNLEIEIPGRIPSAGIVIVTAQYDTWPDSPGANNNGSGMAVLMQLSRVLRDHRPDRTLRLVAFTVQEPPYNELGSRMYAQRCRERDEKIHVMMSMDAIGIYKQDPHTQKLPFPFSLLYPDRGNFLAFIADLRSRSQVEQATRGFKRGSNFHIETAAVPRSVKGATWSDHHSFWSQGYRAIQITDTGAFRAESHTNARDTMEKIDFAALARITLGMYGAILELTSVETD